MSRRASSTTLVGLAGFLLLSGCMDSPRHGQVLSGATVSFPISGAVTYPSDTLTFQVMNQITGDWYGTGTTVTSSASANYTDGQGVKWYFYNGTARLTRPKYLWRKAKTRHGQRRVTATVRTYSKKGNGALYSFKEDIDACVETYGSQGGIAIAQNCHAPPSPNAQLVVHCGKPGQDCCIAHDVPDDEACETGRLCGVDKRCSVPSGGLNQRCEADGSCGSGLSCVSDYCRDTTKDGAPLYSLDLEVRTCDDAGWLSNDEQFVAVRFGDRYAEARQVLDDPGNDHAPGAWRRYSLVFAVPKVPADDPSDPPRAATLGELGDMWITTGAGEWCFDEIRLFANGDPVFSRSYATPVHLQPRYPENFDSWWLPQDEVRNAYLSDPNQAVCDAPDMLSADELERYAKALIANGLANVAAASWGDAGWLRMTREDENRIELLAWLAAEPPGIAGTHHFTIRSYVSFNCSNGELSLDATPVELLDVQGGISNLVRPKIEEALELLNEDLDIGTILEGLPACPGFEVVSDADGRASMEIQYPAIVSPEGLLCL